MLETLIPLSVAAFGTLTAGLLFLRSKWRQERLELMEMAEMEALLMGTPKSQQSLALQSAMQSLAEAQKTAQGTSVEAQKTAQQFVVNQMQMAQLQNYQQSMMQLMMAQQQPPVQQMAQMAQMEPEHQVIAHDDAHPPLPGRPVVKEPELVKERKRKVRVV